ncbi:hypothetical protein DKX38_027310 [Salix brachista]|uniref:Uncharacterized protein n=1 Tax=Salix brachista TaxID=2182728 RepID=A0A5N5JCL2_9ROSI|nr:hypothetical protein DKX38_027310 [Salix brachista]
MIGIISRAVSDFPPIDGDRWEPILGRNPFWDPNIESLSSRVCPISAFLSFSCHLFIQNPSFQSALLPGSSTGKHRERRMDQTLLPKEEKRWVLTWDAFEEELRRVSCLAAPMMVVSVTLYLLQVVSVIMAGHLSELSLSGVSMATSFTNVTGFSLLVNSGHASSTSIPSILQLFLI